MDEFRQNQAFEFPEGPHPMSDGYRSDTAPNLPGTAVRKHRWLVADALSGVRVEIQHLESDTTATGATRVRIERLRKSYDRLDRIYHSFSENLIQAISRRA